MFKLLIIAIVFFFSSLSFAEEMWVSLQSSPEEGVYCLGWSKDENPLLDYTQRATLTDKPVFWRPNNFQNLKFIDYYFNSYKEEWVVTFNDRLFWEQNKEYASDCLYDIARDALKRKFPPNTASQVTTLPTHGNK